MEKRHGVVEKELEEKIEKVRSSFKEGDTDEKGEQEGGSTARKIKRKRSNTRYKTAKKVVRSQNKRTTSYSGKEMEGKNNKRLRDDHNDATNINSKSSKKREGTKPEHDFTPPRGPSLGR